MTKGARTRAQEGALLDAAILNLIAECVAIPARLPVLLLPSERFDEPAVRADNAIADVVSGARPFVGLAIDGQIIDENPSPCVLISGSFNPAHDGHFHLAHAAQRVCRKPAAFEICVRNVDKPALDYEETRWRAAQFVWRAPLWLTNAPTFVEKATLFPGAIFGVGVDTAERVLQPKYYGDESDKLRSALDLIRAQGCRFLVAGRIDTSGSFRTLRDLIVDGRYRDLFVELPESVFRQDVSSSEIRAKQLQSGR
jgi:hypothetical protein